ncbi:hypothetical protein CC2G_001611 [Coprinopsis cinerea AmutBmut pab1-1]|nr:hypothetical protein CC2G_001611 [Coprinopsis cinerea AmutBmut pab1-1]
MLIELPTGVSLDCTWLKPSSTTEEHPQRLAVCLHPWSWLGGQKNDPVLCSLTDVLHDAGYHMLRYNSRGVGRSTGRASFTGLDEARDLEAVIEWAVQEIPRLSNVVIIGYSHGSLIASLHPSRHSAVKVSHVLLSYPLGPRSFLTLFKGSYYDQKLEELVQNPDSRVLIIYGDQDEFTSVERYRNWVTRLQNLANSDRLRIAFIEGASHFWHGDSNEQLRSSLSSWISHLS